MRSVYFYEEGFIYFLVPPLSRLDLCRVLKGVLWTKDGSRRGGFGDRPGVDGLIFYFPTLGVEIM